MKRFALKTPVDADDHVLGAADAPVTVVEYADFQCPYCAQAAPGIRLMLLRYGSSVRYVFRHFPQEDIHPHALPAAEAAEAAATQGQFWPMHDLLYRQQPKFDRSDLDAYAREVGLDLKAFAQQLDAHAHLPRILSQARDGRRSGVRSTPGLFINGHSFDVAFDLQHLYDAIDAELTE